MPFNIYDRVRQQVDRKVYIVVATQDTARDVRINKGTEKEVSIGTIEVPSGYDYLIVSEEVEKPHETETFYPFYAVKDEDLTNE